MSNNKNKLTIITVTLNSEKFIEKTIKSVINQSYKNFEYLIIDGKSNDKTISIINKYKNKINKIVSEKDDGIYAAMNKGLKFAKGEWVLILNAGDYLTNKNILLNIFKKKIDAKSSIIYSDANIVDLEGKILEVYKTNHQKRKFNHQCIIYRKTLHKKFGYYIEATKSTISDYIFFCQIPKKHFIKVEERISCYLINGVSNSMSHAIQRIGFEIFMGYLNKRDILIKIFISSFKFFFNKLKKNIS